MRKNDTAVSSIDRRMESSSLTNRTAFLFANQALVRMLA